MKMVQKLHNTFMSLPRLFNKTVCHTKKETTFLLLRGKYKQFNNFIIYAFYIRNHSSV